jgi:glycosyltransferase involved in cell wall biosynthesis
MSLSSPEFSVVIPTFDRLSMLKEAISSVDQQSFRNFEIVVAVDASTDGTWEWLEENRPDIVRVNSGGTGAGGARNAGIAAARGEFISLLDDDDLWHPQYLELVHNLILKKPHLNLIVVTEHRFHEKDHLPAFKAIDLDGEEVSLQCYSDVMAMVSNRSHFLGTSVWGAIRRKAFTRFGAFTVNRGMNMEDLDWLFRAGELAEVAVITEPHLLAYRLHAAQITQDPRKFYESLNVFLAMERQGKYPQSCFFPRRRHLFFCMLFVFRTTDGLPMAHSFFRMLVSSLHAYKFYGLMQIPRLAVAFARGCFA